MWNSMSISSAQPITANTHLYLPVEVWSARIRPLLAFGDIVSLFFQTCHFLRTSRVEILSPIAAAEQELMQITPYQGRNLPLERIVSVWLRLPSASLRMMRNSLAERPPIIYASQFANASVLLNERLITLYGENGLLSPRALPPANQDSFTTTFNLALQGLIDADDLIDAEESITRACLIVRTVLDPDRAAQLFRSIAFRGGLLWGSSGNFEFGKKHPDFWGYNRFSKSSESQVWARSQVVMNHVPNELRDLVYSHLATTSYTSRGKLAVDYASLIKDNDLREKMLGKIAKNDADISEWAEKCAEKTLKRKPPGSDSDDDDSRPSKVAKVSNSSPLSTKTLKGTP
jgi:hypothetical protein